MSSETIDWMSMSMVVDPYPTFHLMRERDPVHFAPELGMWMLFRYQDCCQLYSNRTLRHEYERGQQVLRGADVLQEPYFTIFKTMVFVLDDPDHKRVRSLFSKSFTPRHVKSLLPQVQEIADGLLEGVAGDGGMDLVNDYATRLPVRVIGRLLGVPEPDQDEIAAKTMVLNQVLGFFPLDAETTAAVNSTIVELSDYFTALAGEKRRNPADDMLSQMVAALDEHDELSMDELVANAMLLYLAAHETTSGSITMAMLSLHRHPDQLAILADDLSLVPDAVEELMRFDPSGMANFRVATQPVNFGETEIPAGGGILAWTGAANRDPARFPDPDRLDVRRKVTHTTVFGGGAHFCLGNALARQEMRVSISSLLRRYPRMNLETLDPIYRPNTFMRGLESMRVTW